MRKEKQIKKKSLQLAAIPAKSDLFHPFLLIAVCAVMGLIALIIDRFVTPFGNGLLAPLIGQLVILMIPAYLFLQLSKRDVSFRELIKDTGFGKLSAEYIFFMLFTALFMMSTSFILNTLFYGIYKASAGFTLLGIFTAGNGEYTVSAPYLILVYALFPAVAEEFLFRGILYKEFSRINEPFAITLSSVVSAVFAFTVGGFPAAFFCALAYCLVRYVTKSLQACIIVHFLFNIYALYLQTNLCKYIMSSTGNILLLIITLVLWLIFSILFFSECGRIFRQKGDRVKRGEESSTFPTFSLEHIKTDIFSILSHTPTLVCVAVSLAVFAAIVIIGIF